MPQTANEEFADALTRHQAYLLNLAGWLRNQMIGILNDTEEQVSDIVLSGMQGNTNLNTKAGVNRVERVEKRVIEVREKAWAEANGLLKDQTEQLVIMEPEFVDGILKTVLPVVVVTTKPSVKRLREILTKRRLRGRTLKQWRDSMVRADSALVRDALFTGAANGDSARSIARTMVGTKIRKGMDGLFQQSRRNVSTNSRSAIMQVANRARQLYFLLNGEIIGKEIYQATLDNKTSSICINNDGEIYKVGEGPHPPLHLNCRSNRIPYFDDVVLEERPLTAVSERQVMKDFTSKHGLDIVKNRNALPYGYKTKFDDFRRQYIRANTGRAPIDLRYPDFLKRQPPLFQEDVLGKTRARLFRTGILKFNKYVDTNSNYVPLNELAKRHSDVFKAAGLNPEDYL